MLRISKIIITLLFASCLISLAGAEKKEGESKIEPKLVYEKRFGFEIGNGKLTDDGEIYPSILLIKGVDKEGYERYRRVLFCDEKGKKAKILNLTNNQLPILSEDGRYVGIASFAEIQVYDYLGRRLCRVISLENCYPDIAIVADAEGIAISHWTQSAGLARVDFYTRKGELTKTYIPPEPFPVDSTAISERVLQSWYDIPHWEANPTNEFIHGAELRPSCQDKNEGYDL